MFANMNAPASGCDWRELAANLHRGGWFQIEAIELRQAARKKDVDDRLRRLRLSARRIARARAQGGHMIHSQAEEPDAPRLNDGPARETWMLRIVSVRPNHDPLRPRSWRVLA